MSNDPVMSDGNRAKKRSEFSPAEKADEQKTKEAQAAADKAARPKPTKFEPETEAIPERAQADEDEIEKNKEKNRKAAAKEADEGREEREAKEAKEAKAKELKEAKAKEKEAKESSHTHHHAEPFKDASPSLQTVLGVKFDPPVSDEKLFEDKATDGKRNV